MTTRRARAIHRFTAPLALSLVALFWLSTLGAELLGDPSLIAWQKRALLIGLVPMILALAATAITGQLLARKYRPTPELAAKRRRMPFIAANGLLVLTPAAIVLDSLAQQGDIGPLFVAVQALELVAGAANFGRLLLMARDGRAMARRRTQPSTRRAAA